MNRREIRSLGAIKRRMKNKPNKKKKKMKPLMRRVNYYSRFGSFPPTMVNQGKVLPIQSARDYNLNYGPSGSTSEASVDYSEVLMAITNAGYTSRVAEMWGKRSDGNWTPIGAIDNPYMDDSVTYSRAGKATIKVFNDSPTIKRQPLYRSLKMDQRFKIASSTSNPTSAEIYSIIETIHSHPDAVTHLANTNVEHLCTPAAVVDYEEYHKFHRNKSLNHAIFDFPSGGDLSPDNISTRPMSVTWLHFPPVESAQSIRLDLYSLFYTRHSATSLLGALAVQAPIATATEVAKAASDSKLAST